jgi:hypothetical protein
MVTVSDATAAQDVTERGPGHLWARQPPVVSLFLSNGNQMQLVLLTSNLTLTVSGTPAGRYGTETCRYPLRDSENQIMKPAALLDPIPIKSLQRRRSHTPMSIGRVSQTHQHGQESITYMTS